MMKYCFQKQYNKEPLLSAFIINWKLPYEGPRGIPGIAYEQTTTQTLKAARMWYQGTLKIKARVIFCSASVPILRFAA